MNHAETTPESHQDELRNWMLCFREVQRADSEVAKAECFTANVE